MLSIRRIGWALVVVLVGSLAGAGPVSAQSPSPDPDSEAPFDLAALLPARIGEVELALQAHGPEEMDERLKSPDDLLMSTLRAALTESELSSTPISMALASPVDAASAEEYQLVAVHVPGTDAAELLNRMFRHMMAEQIRASGVDDPEEVERMVEGFESVLPRRTLGSREVLSPNEGSDTTFEFFYPYGDVFILGRGADGVSMEGLLALLP